MLKDDCRLFSRLFISCQSRQCDLQEFFKHENQTSPASLSDSGKFHTCQKSQLAELLQAQVAIPDKEPRGDNHNRWLGTNPVPTSIIPCRSKSFDDYAREEVIQKIESYCTKYQRVDVVFDVYKSSSLKSETRSKRGQGVRRRVTETSNGIHTL